MKYRCLVLDPPWPETLIRPFAKTRHSRPDRLPYPTLSIEQIRSLPVPELADTSAHLWLWTTNRSLPDGFDLMKHWGFRYLAPIHWVKPSGFGAWFVHRTQTLLFGYRGKLVMGERFKPNVVFAPSVKHSKKPEASYQLIEQVSPGPRLEMFARAERPGWETVGDGIDGRDIFESLRGLT